MIVTAAAAAAAAAASCSSINGSKTTLLQALNLAYRWSRFVAPRAPRAQPRRPGGRIRCSPPQRTVSRHLPNLPCCAARSLACLHTCHLSLEPQSFSLKPFMRVASPFWLGMQQGSGIEQSSRGEIIPPRYKLVWECLPCPQHVWRRVVHWQDEELLLDYCVRLALTVESTTDPAEQGCSSMW